MGLSCHQFVFATVQYHSYSPDSGHFVIRTGAQPPTWTRTSSPSSSWRQRSCRQPVPARTPVTMPPADIATYAELGFVEYVSPASAGRPSLAYVPVLGLLCDGDMTSGMRLLESDSAPQLIGCQCHSASECVRARDCIARCNRHVCADVAQSSTCSNLEILQHVRGPCLVKCNTDRAA